MHTGSFNYVSGMLAAKRRILLRIKRVIILILFFALYFPVVFSRSDDNSDYQAVNYNFRQFTVEEGLSQNLVSAIHQDHLGFIWAGTKDGLNMFDGYNFKVFKYDPSDVHSLTDNHITVIYEDPYQRLWVGTFNGGLHYFDRARGQFICFSYEPGNENSISNNHIQAITGDSYGNLWVGTNGGGLNKLTFNGNIVTRDNRDITIQRYNKPSSGFPESNARISTLFIDRYDILWVGTRRNIFAYDLTVSESSFLTIPSYSDLPDLSFSNASGYSGQEGARIIFGDNDEGIWMANWEGLFRLDTHRQHFTGYRPVGQNITVSNISTAAYFQNGDSEEIWVSSEDRIYILNLSSGKFMDISLSKYPGIGLQRGWLISLYADDGGGMWVGSNGYGLSLFNPGTIKFNYPIDWISGDAGTVISSRDLSIRSFYESQEGDNTLWIGANEGLFKVDRAKSVMQQVQFFNPPGNEDVLVFSIRGDEHGFIWIGIAWGLVRFNPVDNSYKLFNTGLSYPGEGNESRVNYIHFSKGDIWVLTPNTIARLDQETGHFKHIRYNEAPLDEFREPVFPCLHEDGKGNFWIAAKNGLHYFDVETGELVSYQNNPNSHDGHYMNDIKTIVPDPLDPDRYLWLGTGGGGFSRFDIQSGSFRNYSESHGLSNNMVYGMLYDNSGSIWMSTNRGLSRFIIAEEVFINYTKADGLQSNEFNSGAYYRSPRGEMFFGGINGYNSFYAMDIRRKTFMAPIVFTDFRLIGDNVEANTLDLLNFINGDKPISISYRHNNFAIDFAALDFENPGNNSFEFSMTTSGETWINIGNNRTVTFTGLNPGTYNLRVRGSNSDGIWSDREAMMIISIARPLWRKPWAYLLYGSVLTALIVGIRKIELSRIRLRNRMKIANFETRKLKELDQLKSHFFANISHEFRTPLTLIKGPLEQLSEKETNIDRKSQYSLMLDNASRLLQLINQLLDLSKLESGNYKLNVCTGDILGFIKGVAMSFASLAEKKSINLRIEESPGMDLDRLCNDFYFDPDKLEKILNNLISNALKFTPENGHVTVKICMNSAKSSGEWLECVVADTGIGIPADKLPYIYDRFYQVDSGSKREHEGTGIGLAYVKELVRVHKAEIRVKSLPKSGTTFSLRFPVGRERYSPGQIIEPVKHYQLNPEPSGPASKDHNSAVIAGNGKGALSKPLVLVVEDHPDVRRYICQNIKNEYRIIESFDAITGISLAEEFIPDLILSDIMMPGMDGYEFCEKIKSSEKTSHIPVILLTARTDYSDRIKGLELGADDYLAKPFNVRELRTRIKNLIDNRRALRERFSSNSVIRPEEISVTSCDADLMEKLLRVVEKNIDNSDFSVENLGREVGMSPSQIHRKLKATVNMPANHFIRSVRMHRAMDLLHKKAGNISEIAYMVGYEDPGYFSKSFHAFFGKLPSELSRQD